jgi:hypothetical protein
MPTSISVAVLRPEDVCESEDTEPSAWGSRHSSWQQQHSSTARFQQLLVHN